MWTIEHAILFLLIALPISLGVMTLLAKLEIDKDKNDRSWSNITYYRNVKPVWFCYRGSNCYGLVYILHIYICYPKHNREIRQSTIYHYLTNW